MKIVNWLIVILTLTVTSQSFSQTISANSSLKNGQSLYATFCMSCHMEDGNGVEFVFPSLVKTGNLKDKNKLIKIVLLGMRGPIVVKGVTFNAEMAGINLSDQETVDLINYIRNSWGNKAALLKAAEVAQALKATVKGYQPF